MGKNCIFGPGQVQQNSSTGFENHNKEYELLVENGAREFSTYRKYCYVNKYLEEFLYYRYKLKDIALIDIRSCFIIDFELYLREKKRCSYLYCSAKKNDFHRTE